MLSITLVIINLIILVGGFICLLVFLLRKPYSSFRKDDRDPGGDGGVQEPDWDRPLDLPPGVYAPSDIHDPVSA
ncbi:MAG: hypothetical protein AAF824_13695 [Bacteroidota bacterium]